MNQFLAERNNVLKQLIGPSRKRLTTMPTTKQLQGIRKGKPPRQTVHCKIAQRVQQFSVNSNILPTVCRTVDLQTYNQFQKHFMKNRNAQTAKNAIILDSLLKILTCETKNTSFSKQKNITVKMRTEQHRPNQFIQSFSPKTRQGPKIVENSITSKLRLRQYERRKIFSQQRSRKKPLKQSEGILLGKSQFTFYNNKSKKMQASLTKELDFEMPVHNFQLSDNQFLAN